MKTFSIIWGILLIATTTFTKRKLGIVALILIAGATVYISCKKEYSCENCRETNKPPIANAGNDTTIILPVDSLMVDGSASSDPDGTISSFQWTKISGPALYTINNTTSANTVVKNLVAGAYQFELNVTDNGGLSANDTVQIIVNDPAQSNRPPVANAGSDQTIALPNNTVNLDGRVSSDPDNNIINYIWTKISGPSSFNFTNAIAVQTQITNLVQGIYQFELKVTDAGGLFSKDTVQISVNDAVLIRACDNSNRPLVDAQLTPVTIMPSGAGHIFANIANKIYFLAIECQNCQVSSKARAYYNIYDVVTQTWSVSRDYLITPRMSGTIVAAGNKIFYAGGYSGSPTTYTVPFSDVDIYDASTDTWSSTALSAGRFDLSGAVVNNKVLFAGGFRYDPNPSQSTSYIPCDIVDIYNLLTQTWSTTSLSQARCHISTVTITDKIYFAGGSAGLLAANGFLGASGRIDIYDDITDTWSVSSLAEPKTKMASIAVGNKIFWAGGLTEWEGWTTSVEIKDINTQSSATTCLFQINFWRPDEAVKKNNKIVFFNGLEGSYDNSKFDIYDITTNTWSIGKLSVNIYRSSIISVNNTLYVVGGNVNGRLSNQVWKLEF